MKLSYTILSVLVLLVASGSFAEEYYNSYEDHIANEVEDTDEFPGSLVEVDAEGEGEGELYAEFDEFALLETGDQVVSTKKPANNSTLKKISNKLRKAGKKVKRSVNKGRKAIKKAKKVVKKVIKKKSLKSKTKASKKALKRSLKKTFKPHAATESSKEQGELKRALRTVVQEEPSSASGEPSAKDNWAFEKTVTRKLNRYTNAINQDELKQKELVISAEAAEICDKVQKACTSADPKKLSNTRTCILTKDACFQFKIALEKTKRAQKQCQIAEEYKARPDFIGKLDYTVELAKCKSYIKSIDYYTAEGSKKHATARTAEVVDAEADDARAKVTAFEPTVEKLQKQLKPLKAPYKACKALVAETKDCADPTAPKCVGLRVKSNKCEQRGDIENYTKVATELKEAKETLKKLLAERNLAERKALKGVAA